MTFDECCATLATTTGLSREEWADFLSLDPVAQCAAVEAYRGASWVSSPDIFAAVLAVLETAATVAGAVSGIAGAYSALKALA